LFWIASIKKRKIGETSDCMILMEKYHEDFRSRENLLRTKKNSF